MDRLRILTGSLQGAVVELPGEKIAVGRSPDNAICLEDASVSDHHATLTCRGRDWVVQDAGSEQGTFVRGKKIRTADLRNGDTLAFGEVKMLFEAPEKQTCVSSGQVFVPTSSADTGWLGRESVSKQAGRRLTTIAVGGLLQVIVIGAVAVGGYWIYQKLHHRTPDIETASSNPGPWTSPSATLAPSVSTTISVPVAGPPPLR